MRFAILLPLLALTACEIAPAAVAQALRDPDSALPNWADADLSWLGDTGDYAQSQAICASVRGAQPPSVDFPGVHETEALAGCSSRDLWYGIGVEEDRVAALQCALLERQRDADTFAADGVSPYPILSGSGILAMAYANGEGAERDLDIALHMACEQQGAPAEMELWITALDEMRRGVGSEEFAMCDWITSGRAGGVCTAAFSALAAQEREVEQAAQIARWPAAERAAFRETLAAFEDYASAANGMNCWGGTLHAACVLSGTEEMQARFADALLAFAEGRSLPPRVEEPKGDGLAAEDTLVQAATVTDAQWRAYLKDLYEPDIAEYETHRADAIAARRAFEPTLVAFAALRRPDLTAHQVRRIFRSY
ncbi:MAG: hypothetical protein WBA68_12920 [Alteraurantiacibacter sp.]